MAIAAAPPSADLERLVSLDASAALRALAASPDGLTGTEAERRLGAYGANEVRAAERHLREIVAAQLTNGFNLLLAFAGLLTGIVGDITDAAIIIALLALNSGLSVVQEYRAERAVAALRALLPLVVWVRRDGRENEERAAVLVPGDVIRLGAGDLVPADCRVLRADRAAVDQATLTGESEPRPKRPEAVPVGPLAAWSDALFAGSTVVAGHLTALVVATGARTQFGKTASLVADIRTPSDFQVNLERFGVLLLRFGLAIAALVFAANALLGRDLVESLTLGIAIALGMVPEALPAVTATSLALGSRRLARRHVLLRRLAAIEDLSVVDTLCSDKTGTITADRTAVTGVWTLLDRATVLRRALECSEFPASDLDIVDQAILAGARDGGVDTAGVADAERRTVLPFSSDAKRTVVVVRGGSGDVLVAKGAAAVVLPRCSAVRTPTGDVPLLAHRAEIDALVDRWQREGARVLAVAERPLAEGDASPDDTALALIGLVALADPPRPGAAAALERARGLGVEVKILTGDTLERAEGLAAQVGIPAGPDVVVDAARLRTDDDGQLALRGRIFGAMVPTDKYRLVRALQQHGRHVAVTGDGVNDAPALKAADVGIAVANGADVAKAAADAVLLDADLGVIVDGLEEGRRLFTKINRYLLYTMVSNVANVSIVAVASLFLDYFALTPEQVLVLNVLADLPMLALVTDNVEAAEVAHPRHWHLRTVMVLSLLLGLLNAIVAFGLLAVLGPAAPKVVRTSWFLLLGTSALLVLFAVRTRGPLWTAPPLSRPLALSLGAAFAVTILLVNVPWSRELFGFVPLPPLAQLGIVALAVLYTLVADLLEVAYFARRVPRR